MRLACGGVVEKRSSLDERLGIQPCDAHEVHAPRLVLKDIPGIGTIGERSDEFVQDWSDSPFHIRQRAGYIGVGIREEGITEVPHDDMSDDSAPVYGDACFSAFGVPLDVIKYLINSAHD